VGWGWDSRAGERMVVFFHTLVSDHVSGPRCSFLTFDGAERCGCGCAETRSTFNTMAERSELAPSQGEMGSFTWRVTALSEKKEAKLYSDTFTVGGVSWCMSLYPKGTGDAAGSHLSLFLNLCDTDRPYGWSCPASFKLVLKSQTDDNVVDDCSNDFNLLGPNWGMHKVRSQLPHGSE
jgi:hypothetical protein